MGPDLLGSLTAALKKFDTLEEFELFSCGITDNGAIELLKVLHRYHGLLKDLKISNSPRISATGWEAVFAAMQGSRCSFEGMSLQNNKMVDTARLALLGLSTTFHTSRR